AIFQLHAALAPTTYIHEWLKSLPLISRVQSWTLTGSRSHGNVTDAQHARRPSSASDGSMSQVSEENWVYIVKAHSEPDLDVPDHLQNTRPPDNCSERPASEVDANPAATKRHLSDPGPGPPLWPHPTHMAP